MVMQLYVKRVTLLCLDEPLASFSPRREIGTCIELAVLEEGTRALSGQNPSTTVKATLGFHFTSSMECT